VTDFIAPAVSKAFDKPSGSQILRDVPWRVQRARRRQNRHKPADLAYRLRKRTRADRVTIELTAYGEAVALGLTPAGSGPPSRSAIHRVEGQCSQKVSAAIVIGTPMKAP